MIRGFAPIVGDRPAVLVLGTMPSVASLGAGAYYAHPRNAFWPLVYRLWSEEPPQAYEERRAFLLARRIALWDVVAACEREGSLDSNIRQEIPNEIPALLAQYPTLHMVFCNGGTAFALLRKHFPQIAAHKLPSTSPAAASLSFAEKLEAWQALYDACTR